MIFAELLKAHLQSAGISVSQLARDSGLPRRTIANWLEGYAHKPRYWTDVVKLAGALYLDQIDTDDLLAGAGFPGIKTLSLHHPEHSLLRRWQNAPLADAIGQRIVAIIGESGGAIFNDLPFAKAVYLMEQAVQLAEMVGDAYRFCTLSLELARCLMTLARYESAAEILLHGIDTGERSGQTEIVFEARCLLVSLPAFAHFDTLQIAAQRHHLSTLLSDSLPIHKRLRALHCLGLWAGYQQRYDEAAYYYHQIYHGAANPAFSIQQIRALNNLGDLAIRQNDFLNAEKRLTEALGLAVREGAEGAAACIRLNLGVIRMRCGDYESAETQFGISTLWAAKAEDSALLFGLHLSRAELALHQDDQSQASAEFSAALAMCSEAVFNDLKTPLTYCLDQLRQNQGHHLLNDPVYRETLYSR